MKKVALMSLLVLLLAVPAFAAPPNYIVLKGGIYSPNHDDLTNAAADFGAGFNGEVALGHYFTPNIALELGAGYMGTSSDTSHYDIDGWAVPITLSLKGVIPFPQGEIYGLVGGGAYIVEGKYNGDGTKDSDTAFGFQVGIGGSLNVTQEVFIGLEGKYFWAKPTFDKLVPYFGHADVHIDGFQGTLNLGFRF